MHLRGMPGTIGHCVPVQIFRAREVIVTEQSKDGKPEPKSMSWTNFSHNSFIELVDPMLAMQADVQGDSLLNELDGGCKRPAAKVGRGCKVGAPRSSVAKRAVVHNKSLTGRFGNRPGKTTTAAEGRACASTGKLLKVGTELKRPLEPSGKRKRTEAPGPAYSLKQGRPTYASVGSQEEVCTNLVPWFGRLISL